MNNRRIVVEATSVIILSLISGCFNSVSGGIGSDQINLSEKKNDVIDLYEEGIDETNVGTDAWNVGISSFNNSEYGKAIDKFETAESSFNAGKESFEKARKSALEIGENDAANLCESGIEYAGLMTDAASVAQKGAKAANNNQPADTINSHIEEARKLEETASDIEVEEPDVLAGKLTNN